MAESPDHEIQMELNVEQEQGQGDVPDDTSVYSDTHSPLLSFPSFKFTEPLILLSYTPKPLG
jgi:hypothetical protein